MSRLVKGMYRLEFRVEGRAPLFGLYYGQYRHRDNSYGHNAGWYNKLGEKLGYGDLSVNDVKRIAAELEEGELFITMGEQDSFWKFVTFNPGTIGAHCATSPEEQAPGQKYVAEKAVYVITKGKIYVGDEGWKRNDILAKKSAAVGVPFEAISAKQLLEMMRR